LIVTFGFQVARVEGQSMAPTLEDQDRLIVNKLVYRIGEPRRGDIVMLYYPLNPDKSFVKRVIAEEGDTVRIVDGLVYVNDIPLKDDYVPSEFRSHDDWGPQVIPEGYYFVMRDHRCHHDGAEANHTAFIDRLGRALPMRALGLNGEIDLHDRVLLHDAHEHDQADERIHIQFVPEEPERQQRAESRRRQAGKNR